MVAELIKKHKLTYVRRSDHVTPDSSTQVVLGDTMGELMLMYGLADIAFVGGSLVKHGDIIHSNHLPLNYLSSVVNTPLTSLKCLQNCCKYKAY